jgi:negative regulator of flagellin synthesis FlgM
MYLSEDTMVKPIHDKNVSLPRLDTDAKLVKKNKTEHADNIKQHDDVKISMTSQQLSKVVKSLDDAPIVDTAKVAQLKNDVSSGNYKINPDKIAKKILQDVA